MARPQKQIDEKQVAKLAYEGCSDRMIGVMLGCSEHTIARRFGAVTAKKRAERRHDIKVAQLKLAKRGNATMLIWLGKNELEQSDHPQTSEMTDGLLTANPALVAAEIPPGAVPSVEPPDPVQDDPRGTPEREDGDIREA